MIYYPVPITINFSFIFKKKYFPFFPDDRYGEISRKIPRIRAIIPWIRTSHQGSNDPEGSMEVTDDSSEVILHLK
jgi:hypothetical protein